MISDDPDFKNRLLHKIKGYGDDYLRRLVSMVRNVEVLRALPSCLVHEIMHSFNESKFKAGSTILSIGEVSENTYFVLKGRVGVFVFTGELSDYQDLSLQQSKL